MARRIEARVTLRLKERAIAEREYRVKRLAAAMSQERSDTRVNVERKQGMTERERQMELDALFAESSSAAPQGDDSDNESDGDDKIYNPLKLPLAWDGKPIPFWLYKLHGLGVEFRCEICGNYVYMGRRAFDKHFNEARHIYGLKCLGITNTTLFREITDIADAVRSCGTRFNGTSRRARRMRAAWFRWRMPRAMLCLKRFTMTCKSKACSRWCVGGAQGCCIVCIPARRNNSHGDDIRASGEFS
jgi:hypothetical protein